MDHEGFRILGPAAGLERASVHRGIVRAAHQAAPARTSRGGFDLSRIPRFDRDVEDGGDPPAVEGLGEEMRACDAGLIASPEYDHAVPGVPAGVPDRRPRPPAHAMPGPRTMVPFSGEGFDAATGDLTDGGTRERPARFLSALQEWTERRGSARRIENADLGRRQTFNTDHSYADVVSGEAGSYPTLRSGTAPPLVALLPRRTGR